MKIKVFVLDKRSQLKSKSLTELKVDTIITRLQFVIVYGVAVCSLYSFYLPSIFLTDSIENSFLPW